MFDRKEYMKKYLKRYAIANERKLKAYNSEWYISNAAEVRDKVKQQISRKRVDEPWTRSFRNAKSRCEYKKHTHYKSYGGKGIKVLATVEDFKFVWYRDNASSMKEPTIDRLDSLGHYELNNIRYIEMCENRRKGGK